MPKSHAVEVEHLTKYYGINAAVSDVSFYIEHGEILALLGRNGAGKTTTIEIIEGFRTASSGRVNVLGFDPSSHSRRLKNQIGIVFQSSALDGSLSVNETLRLYARFYRPRRSVVDVLMLVDLTEQGTTRVKHLSGGQRRRLDLALALIGQPAVVFLDEPTTGLDPAARRRTWEVIDELRRNGVAVLLTSHYLEEVETLADRVIVLHKGQVIAEGDPDELRETLHPRTTISFRLSHVTTLPEGPWEPGLSRLGLTTLSTATPTAAIHQLASWAMDHGVELEGLEMSRPSLEDAYLDLTHDV